MVVAPEAGDARLEDGLVGEHAGVHQVRRRVLAVLTETVLGALFASGVSGSVVVVVVVAEGQLVLRADLPVQLPEDAVRLLVGEERGSTPAGDLASDLVLVGGEEPELVLQDRARELERGVAEVLAMEGEAAVLGVGRVAPRQAVRLEVEVGVAVELRSIPGGSRR